MKRKTPKTYLRNSKKTIAQHEKACQVLASQGFHNIFSFISLKEREWLAAGRSLEHNEPPSCLSFGAVEESVSLDVDALSTINEPCCSSPGGGTGGSLQDANMEASSLIGSSRCSLLGGRGRCLEENTGRSSLMQDANIGAVSMTGISGHPLTGGGDAGAADVNEMRGHCTGLIKDARTMTRSLSTMDASCFLLLGGGGGGVDMNAGHRSSSILEADTGLSATNVFCCLLTGGVANVSESGVLCPSPIQDANTGSLSAIDGPCGLSFGGGGFEEGLEAVNQVRHGPGHGMQLLAL